MGYRVLPEGSCKYVVSRSVVFDETPVVRMVLALCAERSGDLVDNLTWETQHDGDDDHTQAILPAHAKPGVVRQLDMDAPIPIGVPVSVPDVAEPKETEPHSVLVSAKTVSNSTGSPMRDVDSPLHGYNLRPRVRPPGRVIEYTDDVHMLHYDANFLAGTPGRELNWPDRDTDGDTNAWALAQQSGIFISDNVPQNDEQTLVVDAEQWELARNVELQVCAKNDTWGELIQVPPGKKVVNLGFIYNIKASADGAVPRYKARLVYPNHPFINDSSWEQVFSPVVNKDMLRLFLTIVGKHRLFLRQADVVTAYLNAHIDEEVYVRLPEICGEDRSLVRQLFRALFGHPKRRTTVEQSVRQVPNW